MAETATNNGSTNTNTSGEGNVALDFTLKNGSDCISDKNMSEIARRLQGFVSSDETGDVVFAKDPPNDTKKIWIETSNTGAIIGTIKRYDTASSQWVDDHFEPDAVTPLKLFVATDDITSDDQVINYNHAFSTSKYIYTVVYKDSPTIEARWFQASSDANDLSLHFLSLSGVTVEVRILEYDNET